LLHAICALSLLSIRVFCYRLSLGILDPNLRVSTCCEWILLQLLLRILFGHPSCSLGSRMRFLEN